MTEASWVYRQSADVAIEDFGERSLALHCVELRLIELNATARDLIARLDGRSALHQVAAAIAEEYHQPPEAVLTDVLASMAQMDQSGLVRRILPDSEATASKAAERPS